MKQRFENFKESPKEFIKSGLYVALESPKKEQIDLQKTTVEPSLFKDAITNPLGPLSKDMFGSEVQNLDNN